MKVWFSGPYGPASSIFRCHGKYWYMKLGTWRLSSTNACEFKNLGVWAEEVCSCGIFSSCKRNKGHQRRIRMDMVEFWERRENMDCFPGWLRKWINHRNVAGWETELDRYWWIQNDIDCPVSLTPVHLLAID